MAYDFELIVGTYEQFLLGYTINDVDSKFRIKQSFAIHNHLASIRSVCSSRHCLASAGADDVVCLYDLQSRMEIGKLIHHNDTVNSACFTPDGSHLITIGNDGTMGLIRRGNWQLEKLFLKPHKGFSVNNLAVHPSGKIAITTGKDGALRTWNLVKGRQAYAINLVPRWKHDAKNVSVLKWNSNGEYFLIAANTRINIYSTNTASVVQELEFTSKVICAEYFNDKFLTVGLNDGTIYVYNIINKTSESFQAHSSRVKCIAYKKDILVSASSSGDIKLWKFLEKKFIFLNEVNCSCRISCLTVTSCNNLKNKKYQSVIKTSLKKIKPKTVIQEEEKNHKIKIIKRLKDKKKLVNNPLKI